MTWTIKTSKEIKYNITRSNNLFNVTSNELSSVLSSRVLIFIDRNVSDLYFDIINDYFECKYMSATFVIVDGEEDKKDIDNLLFILKSIENFGIDRRQEPVLVVGGGVLCDLVGTACSLYRRGIPYVRVPTTLLGMVDVSVAAKVAINWQTRRNRLGAYYPANETFIDKSFLNTLPEIEISSGLGEILKIAVIKDYKLFSILENHSAALFENKFSDEISDEVIDLSCVDMIEELQNNLWETDLKRCVDFGHSFSPIIEMRSLEDRNVLSLTHGQAVALDVIFSCILSANRALLPWADVFRVIRVAKDMRLLIEHEYFKVPALLFESLQDVTKHRDGNQNLPIPTEIGNNYIFLQDVTYKEIIDVVAKYERIVTNEECFNNWSF